MAVILPLTVLRRNHQMGLVFEGLIRRFSETPPEVIRLMVNLLFVEDDDVLSKPGVVRTIHDPPLALAACCRSRATT